MLDNFEHLLEAAPRVADLLRAAPSVRALVTSRAPLRVEGEILFQVPPLAVPELEGPPAPEAVRRYSAIRLFEERARLARADFAVTADTAPAVTAICARLDGLPLAIELAAARVSMLPLPDLLARLGGKFVLHLEGLRERPARHRSMNEAVGWSYDLLDPEEQRAFRFMGVFLGGFALEAAQAVWAPLGAPNYADAAAGLETIKVVTGLAEKGLLVPGEGPVGEARFTMLAVIREYSLVKQDEAGEADAAGERHAAYFRWLVDTAEPQLRGPDQVAWLNRLGADQHNLRAALRWSLAKDVETGLAIASGLWRFWLVRSHVSEGRDWLEQLLAASTLSSDGPSEWRAKAGYVAANLASVQGDGPRARSLADECLAASRDTHNRELLAYSLAVAGDAAYKVNEFELGDRLLREGLEIFRRAGIDSGAAFCLGSLALLAVMRDDMGGSAPMRNECLALYRRLGDTWGIVQGLSQMGGIARIECKYVDSLAFHEEQLRLARELGSNIGHRSGPQRPCMDRARRGRSEASIGNL